MENNELVLHQVNKARTTASCPMCGRTMLKRTLQRHIRSMHPVVSGQLAALFRCNDCGQIFGRRDNLERHILTQHEKKDDLVECLTCSAQVRERSLDEHHKSRRCQMARQANTSYPGMEMLRLFETKTGSLGDLGRFGPESVLNPMTVACVLGINFSRYKALSVDRPGFRPIE